MVSEFALDNQTADIPPQPVPDYFGEQEQVMVLRDGLALVFGQFCLKKRQVFSFYSSEEVCEFAFVLSGTFQNRFPGRSEDLTITPLSATIWLTPRMPAQHDCGPGSDISFVCVRIRRKLLTEMAGSYLHQAPERFRRILENRENSLFYRLSPMTLPMQAAARQVFACPYQGAMRRLFLEAKALELISHLMEFHFGGTRVAPPRHTKQIARAHDLLLENMESPPSLSELARQSGINETLLTREFRKQYGTSVFAYLRDQRLKKAQMLLETDERNITEIAYALGYASPSHFTRLFTKAYGIPPREYRNRFTLR